MAETADKPDLLIILDDDGSIVNVICQIADTRMLGRSYGVLRYRGNESWDDDEVWISANTPPKDEGSVLGSTYCTGIIRDSFMREFPLRRRIDKGE